MIVGINGKIFSGKDTVGNIIRFLIYENLGFVYTYDEFIKESELYKVERTDFEIKKFAGKLKQIVSLLTGCTLEQLEDQEFKSSKLGREWQDFENTPKTYRWMLQTIGTESMRDIIHLNVWINALFADYRVNNPKEGATYSAKDFPNWIITDMRFPNEFEAVKQHQGITIRVKRKKEDKYYYQAEYYTLDQLRDMIKGETGEYPIYEYCKNFLVKEHESETALDNAIFDYEIDNNGTIEELIQKVRQILISAKILS